MKAYKQAGAKYFVTMGVHHDNFDLWKSKHQRAGTRWRWGRSATSWRTSRRRARRGPALRHQRAPWVTYKWFSISRDHDDQGPLAGVPYDGGSKDAADLYQTCPRSTAT
jgi:alpha-L-fucosidase